MAHKKAEATKKINLKEELKKFDNAEQFVLNDPQVYSRFRNSIIDYYAAVLRNKPSHMPYIEWHFGETRSGKTFAGYALTGGRDCRNTHC